MPQTITQHTDTLVVWRAFSGGWIVSDASGEKIPSELLRHAEAACSDDEGLVDWFAAQLGFGDKELQARPPNPGPAVEAAGANSPAADTPNASTVLVDTLAAIQDALKPFAAHAVTIRDQADGYLIDIEAPAGRASTAIYARDLRALLKAAGLLTDDMLPKVEPPTPAEHVAAVAALKSPPAAPAVEADKDLPF